MSSNRLVLPLPFGPTTAMRSPGRTWKLTGANNRCPRTRTRLSAIARRRAVRGDPRTELEAIASLGVDEGLPARFDRFFRPGLGDDGTLHHPGGAPVVAGALLGFPLVRPAAALARRAFEPSDLLSDAGVFPFLPGKAFQELRSPGRERTAVCLHRVRVQRDDVVDARIQERAVVGHHQEPGLAAKVAGKALARTTVEVIGRLVDQRETGLPGEQAPRQQAARPLAPAQRVEPPHPADRGPMFQGIEFASRGPHRSSSRRPPETGTAGLRTGRVSARRGRHRADPDIARSQLPKRAGRILGRRERGRSSGSA